MRFGWLYAGVVVSFAGCSGPASLNFDAGPPGGPEIDGGTACYDFATAKCAKFDSCTNGMYTTLYYGGPAQCREREGAACAGLLGALDETASPNGFEQCGRDIAAGTCADFFNVTNQTPACTPESGPRPDGAPCVDSGQCQSAWCYAAATAPCGVCSTRPRGGAPCATNVDCGSLGMICTQASTCAAVVTAGGACGLESSCGFGLSCVGSTATSSGTCETEGTSVGAVCDTARTSAPGCEHYDGLYCPGSPGQCAAATVVDTGAVCGLTPGSVVADASAPSLMSICTSGAVCDPISGPMGTCIGSVADGAPCDSVNGPPCLAPARCVSASDASSTTGVCAVLDTSSCN